MENIPNIGENIPKNSDSSIPKEEKEYSLEQFRKDYLNILKTEVYPKLEPYEKNV